MYNVYDDYEKHSICLKFYKPAYEFRKIVKPVLTSAYRTNNVIHYDVYRIIH